MTGSISGFHKGLRKRLHKTFGKIGQIILIAASLVVAAPAVAQSGPQCAPYAREISGIQLHGAAGGWWGQASGLYARGSEPRVGSVLAFRATRAMPSGHVAVVHAVVDSRHILLDHANWSRPGMIEHAALAEDVSPNGDWSQVRVWFAPIGGLGLRAAPTFGFIYRHAGDSAPTDSAPTDAVADAGDGGARQGVSE